MTLGYQCPVEKYKDVCVVHTHTRNNQSTNFCTYVYLSVNQPKMCGSCLITHQEILFLPLDQILRRTFLDFFLLVMLFHIIINFLAKKINQESERKKKGNFNEVVYFFITIFSSMHPDITHEQFKKNYIFLSFVRFFYNSCLTYTPEIILNEKIKM